MLFAAGIAKLGDPFELAIDPVFPLVVGGTSRGVVLGICLIDVFWRELAGKGCGLIDEDVIKCFFMGVIAIVRSTLDQVGDVRPGGAQFFRKGSAKRVAIFLEGEVSDPVVEVSSQDHSRGVAP